MKKFLKIFGIIIAVILVILAIHTIRNFVIMINLQNNIKQYAESENYHLKTVSKETTGTKMTVNYYRKQEKQVVIQTKNNDDQEVTISMYDTGNGIKSYYDTPNDKFVKLNMPSLISVNITSFFEGFADSMKSKIFMSMILNIKSTQINDKDCYAVSILSPVRKILGESVDIEYIEKDTGLCIKSSMAELVVQKEYEFDNVKDEIFIEPDISEYRIDDDELFIKDNPDENDDSITEVHVSKCSPQKVKIEVVEDSISNRGAKIIVTDTNEHPYAWGESYRVQKKEDGQWKDIEPIGEMIFKLLAYVLDENNQVSFDIDWTRIYGELPNGTYRIVKPVYDDGYIDLYSNEFEIK